MYLTGHLKAETLSSKLETPKFTYTSADRPFNHFSHSQLLNQIQIDFFSFPYQDNLSFFPPKNLNIRRLAQTYPSNNNLSYRKSIQIRINFS